MNRVLKKLGRLLPKAWRRRILRLTRRPGVGRVDFGQLRRLEPISRDWGGDRGLPVDRHYIEAFLATHAEDIRGRVLEVGNDVYTRRFGGRRVERAEVVHAAEDNARADWVADFADAPHLPANAFDCIVCTQTLQLVADLDAAVATLHRILVPGGVLLATVPGISPIYSDNEGRWGDFWRFTARSAGWLFERAFGTGQVRVEACGNVLAAIAFLHGLATEELSADELAHRDPQYDLLITVRAEKAG